MRHFPRTRVFCLSAVSALFYSRSLLKLWTGYVQVLTHRYTEKFLTGEKSEASTNRSLRLLPQSSVGTKTFGVSL